MIRSRQMMWVAIAGVLASLLAGGCGSGDSETAAAGTTGPLSKSQFVKAADRICKKGLEEKDETLKAAGEEVEGMNLEGTELTKKRKEVAEDMLSHYQQIAAEIEALQPPPKDEAAIEDFLAKMEGAISKGEKNALSLVAMDPFGKADAAAKAYGLVRCSSL